MAQSCSPEIEVRPYLLVGKALLAPVVLTCEHASHRLPAVAAAPRALRGVLRSHWGWDLGAWGFTQALARQLRTSAVGGRWSRLWVDLNRRVDEVELIRTTVDGVRLPWNAKLTVGEVERRVTSAHAAYHAEIDRLIARRLVRGVRPLVLAVHSFTPELAGRPRRFDVGVLYDAHRGPATRLARGVREAGFAVRYNEPYSGVEGLMYAAERHGCHHGLPCLEIEVNQALLAQPPRVQRLVVAVAAALAGKNPRVR